MDRTTFDRIIAQPLPQVGERYRLTEAFERYPHCMLEAGAIGTIVEATPDNVLLMFDDHVDGLEEWVNCGQWTPDDMDGVELPEGESVVGACSAFIFHGVERIVDFPMRSLAALFAQKLRDCLTDDEWEAMRETNRGAEPGICASHDFCDANMPMDEAFKVVAGHEVDGDNDADTSLWNGAWTRAKEVYLTAPEPPPEAVDGHIDLTEAQRMRDAYYAAFPEMYQAWLDIGMKVAKGEIGDAEAVAEVKAILRQRMEATPAITDPAQPIDPKQYDK